MAGVSIDTFGAAFIKYIPGITESLNDIVTMRKYARNDYKWEGANIQFYVHVARNHGVGNIEDGGAFPVADKQDYVAATAFRRFLVGSVQITDGNLANAATTKNAAIDVVTSELSGMLDGMAKYEDFMSFRDGTGVVGKLGSDITGTTWGATDARLLWDGQTYEVRDAAAIATQHGTVQITSVARALDANGNFAVTSAAALPAGGAATDFLVWPGSVNRAITGLQSMVDDTATTFQNVNTTTYPRYTSPVLSNSGTNRSLTPNLFRKMLAMIKQESGGADPVSGLTVLTSTWQAIEVEELYESELRITPDSKKVGTNAPTFQSSLGTIRVESVHACPYNQMFFVDFSQIYRGVQKELDWRRDKAGGIFQRSDTSAVWRATAMEIGEYFIKQRNKCGRIDDLTETAASAY